MDTSFLPFQGLRRDDGSGRRHRGSGQGRELRELGSFQILLGFWIPRHQRCRRWEPRGPGIRVPHDGGISAGKNNGAASGVFWILAASPNGLSCLGPKPPSAF